MFDPGMIDCGGINQKLAAFDARNGGNPVVVSGWFLYENGARRERNPLGIMWDPPKDAWERAKRSLLYYEAKLDLAVEEFTVHKRNLLFAAEAGLREMRCPPPPTEKKAAVAKLKILKAKVAYWKGRVDNARAAVDEAKPEWIKKQAAEIEGNRQQSQDFVSAIKNINV